MILQNEETHWSINILLLFLSKKKKIWYHCRASENLYYRRQYFLVLEEQNQIYYEIIKLDNCKKFCIEIIRNLFNEMHQT